MLGYVKDNNVKAAAVLPMDGIEEELAEDWDSTQLSSLVVHNAI